MVSKKVTSWKSMARCEEVVACVLLSGIALVLQSEGKQSLRSLDNVGVFSTDCGLGTYINGSHCVDCPIGYYQEEENMEECDGCGWDMQSCFYTDSGCADDAAERETDACKDCPEGWGGTGKNEPCITCPAGNVLRRDRSCEECGQGLYSEGGAVDECTYCPDGYVTEGRGAVSIDDCKACEMGKFRDRGPSDAVCVECDSGKFSDEKATEGKCPDCPTGYFASRRGSTSCTKCPMDSIIRNGTGFTSQEDACADSCGPGFRHKSKRTECDACPEGFYQPLTFSENCFPCPPGTSNPFPASISYKNCTGCSAGAFSTMTGSDSCQVCPKGSSSDGVNSTNSFIARLGNNVNTRISFQGFTRCELCGIGFYADVTKAASCIPCLPGRTTNSSGATDILDCVKCLKGTFELDGICNPCSIGTFGPIEGISGSCTFCRPGSFQNATGQTFCFNCKQGFIPNPLDNGGATEFGEACIEASPAPTSTPSKTSSPSGTSSLTSSSTSAPSTSVTATGTATPSPTNTGTQSVTATSTVTGTVTPTDSPTSTGTPTISATSSSTATATPTISATSSSTTTATPSESAPVPPAGGGSGLGGHGGTDFEEDVLPWLLLALALLLLLCLIIALVLRKKRRKKKQEEDLDTRGRSKTTVESMNPLQDVDDRKDEHDESNKHSKTLRSQITAPISERNLHSPHRLGHAHEQQSQSSRQASDFLGDKRNFAPSRSRNLKSNAEEVIDNPLGQEEERGRSESVVKRKFRQWFGKESSSESATAEAKK